MIIDDTLHGGDLYIEWVKHFEKFKPLKVLLMPSKEIIFKRNRERQTHHVEETVMKKVYENFTKHDYFGWQVIDNGAQSIEETVAGIKKKLAI